MSQLEMMRGRVVVAVVIMAAVLFQCDVVVQGAKTYIILWGPNPNLSGLHGAHATENDVVEFKKFNDSSRSYSVAKVNITGLFNCDSSSKVRFGNILDSGDDKFGLAAGNNYFISANSSLCKGGMRFSLFALKWRY